MNQNTTNIPTANITVCGHRTTSMTPEAKMAYRNVCKAVKAKNYAALTPEQQEAIEKQRKREALLDDFLSGNRKRPWDSWEYC